jgi:hypothetical protein
MLSGKKPRKSYPALSVLNRQHLVYKDAVRIRSGRHVSGCLLPSSASRHKLIYPLAQENYSSVNKPMTWRAGSLKKAAPLSGHDVEMLNMERWISLDHHVPFQNVPDLIDHNGLGIA